MKDQNLYLAKEDGSEPRKLATLSGMISWVRWSPDGTRLRFTNTISSTGLSSLWEVSANGENLRSVFPGWNQPSAECCGNWSADGRYYVFQSTRLGKTEIWAASETRTPFDRRSAEPIQITRGQLDSLAPVFSPDGRKIYVIGQQMRGELVRYESRIHQFLPFLSGLSAEFVEFSSDGQWVTYVTFPDGALWRSRVNGSERLQLTTPPIQATAPRWSPDGKKLVFFDSAPGKPWTIYLVSADGGQPQSLSPEPHNQIDPDWSSDGHSIVFSYFPLFEQADSERTGIYTIDLATHKPTKLPGSRGMWAPRLSPDRRYIVARAGRSQGFMLFDSTTGRWTELFKGTVGWAEWSRDQKYIYFLRRGQEPAVLRIALRDRKLEEVASLKDVVQTGFRAGVWAGLTPDNAPLVLRDAGTQEIYALDWHEH